MPTLKEFWTPEKFVTKLGALKFPTNIFYEEQRTPHYEMDKAMELFETRPMVNAGIKQIARFIAGEEITVRSSDKRTHEFLNDWIKLRPDLDNEIFNFIINVLVTGNGYVEMAWKKMANGDLVLDNIYNINDVSRVYKNMDYKGNDDQFWLYEVPIEVRMFPFMGEVKTPSFWKINYVYGSYLFQKMIWAIPIHKSKIRHCKIGWSRDNIYGRGFLASAIDDGEVLKEILKNFSIIARYRALGRKIISIGSPEDPATLEDMDKLESDLKQIEDKDHIVINKPIRAEPLSYTGENDPMETQIEFLRRDIASGLVPNYLTPWSSEVNRACYDLSNTLVLTENRGWVKHEEVLPGEKIALYDKEKDKMVFSVPKKLFTYDVKDEEMQFVNGKFNEFKVTNEHKILYKSDLRSGKKWKVIKAKEMPKRSKLIFKTAAEFDGEEREYTEIEGMNILNYNVSPITLKTDLLLKLTGIFLSEGCISGNHYSISFSQSMNANPEKVRKIDEFVKELPFNVTRSQDKHGIVRWSFNNKQMYKWFEKYCGNKSYNKRIPRQFMRLSKRQRKILFDYLMLGDGTTVSECAKKEGRKDVSVNSIGAYATTSRQLAEDFQELSLTLGYSATLNEAYKVNGKRRSCYRVSVNKRDNRSVSREQRSTIKFTGRVGCFETETGFYFIKVNDKITVQGNTSQEAKIPFELEIKSIQSDIIQFLNKTIIDELRKVYPWIAKDATFDFGHVDLETNEEKANYAITLYQNNLITLNEMRKMIGFDSIEGGDKFLRDIESSPTVPGNPPMVEMAEFYKGMKLPQGWSKLGERKVFNKNYNVVFEVVEGIDKDQHGHLVPIYEVKQNGEVTKKFYNLDEAMQEVWKNMISISKGLETLTEYKEQVTTEDEKFLKKIGLKKNSNSEYKIVRSRDVNGRKLRLVSYSNGYLIFDGIDLLKEFLKDEREAANVYFDTIVEKREKALDDFYNEELPEHEEMDRFFDEIKRLHAEVIDEIFKELPKSKVKVERWLKEQTTVSGDIYPKLDDVFDKFNKKISDTINNAVSNLVGFVTKPKVKLGKDPDASPEAEKKVREKAEVLRKRMEQQVKSFNDRAKTDIVRTISDGIAADKSPNDIKNEIKLKYDRYKVKEAPQDYQIERVAKTEVINNVNLLKLIKWKEMGFEKTEQLVHIDERTCEVCRPLNHKIFDIDYLLENPDKRAPLHPNCYDDETEVLTDAGWKLFKDLDRTEKILTLKPDLDLEYLKPLNYIEYDYSGKMIKFVGQGVNLKVTPNHRMFIGKRTHKRDRKIISWRIQEAEEVGGEYYFYKSSEWKGSEIKNIQIGDKIIPMELFCKFMGYYLSEGSCTLNRRQIKISQKKYLSKMFEDLRNLPYKVCLGKEAIYIIDKDLADYLSQFGKSHQKYVPQIIKDSNKEYIRIFLDAFNLGDGSIKKGKIWKGSKFKDSKIYFTSSKQLASDIGELIIKVGNSVSYSLNKCKGKKQKFSNGEYTINNDIWIINELTSKKVAKISKVEEEYSGKVYCVEMPKNGIILVRRRGKVVWCGNCRCTYVAYS